MRKQFLFSVVLLFITVTIFSQSLPKGITIYSEAGKTPLPDVTVYTSDFSFAEITDENGFVSFKNLPANAKKIIISAIGFETKNLMLAEITNTTIWLQSKITTLNDVVVRASSKTGIFKTISDLDIHIRPIVNSQEILRMVPGLFIGQHAGGGKAEQIFLRGFDLDHGTDIHLSVDGLPVNMVSHAHGQGYADLHFVIPELIDKVNFSKGPYYSDKGNLATAGYVAFKTKNYLEKNFFKLEGGQYNTVRAITGINLLPSGNSERNQSLYFAGEGSFTKGYFDSPQDFSRFNGMIKYHGKTGNNSTLTALVSGLTSKWNASGQIPDRAVADGTIGFFGAIDNNEGGNTSRYNATAELMHNLGNGAVIKNQLFYSRYLFELYSNFTFFKEDPVNGDQIRQKEARDILGYNLSYQQDNNIGNKKGQFSTGAQLRYDIIDNIELTRTKNRTVNTQPIMLGDINELNAGVFAQEKVVLNSKWDIAAGIRLDYFTNKYNDKLASAEQSSNSVIVSPKLNLNYRMNDKVQLYWYSGQGFHSNDTRVAVVQNGRDVVTPAWGSDVGGIFKLGKKAMLQTAVWYLWLKQEFVYVGDEGVVEPGGKTQRIGWDLSLRYELSKSLYADADITLTNPRALEVDKAESYLPLAPRFTSVGGITYRKEKGWNGSLRYRYMANRPANEDNSVIAKGYFVADAAINYTKNKWEAGISVQNLFNTKWKETQFDTESRLQNETTPVSEIHFTPGTPFFARLSFSLFF
ncbi:MAG TPA: TonB-dependent receptor plug domain-containing protein [Chitinophagaceae bacterium]|jgi:outer membrane receptor protein involved in Fe transport|nr:TonB-dependent receptor plug domain-containing protein [Chitinophagaceae bacterium]HMU57935.1 TonB-dependent receptor plug domain-containing protein [Chitinophagaceae bacterium]